ncbi:MAG: AmmeMemoRadiSam system protein A [Coriobacteriales bacterium]|nr:AmmeMemoRadiSam system protein A [Coriobacteriales bacterium]
MAILAAYAVPHPPLAVPAVGRGREHEIQDTLDAYEDVARRIARHAPDTIVVTSPHALMYRDYFHVSPGSGASGDFSRFGVWDADYEVDYDEPLVRELCRLADEQDIPAGTLGNRMPELDHGTMVPLHFIQAACEREGVCPRYVRIGLSGLPLEEHYRLGMAIAQAAHNLDRRVVMLASGDLSHKLLAEGPYGFAPEGPVFDEQVCAALGSGDFLALLSMDQEMCERAAECGWRSFVIMAGALDKTEVAPELLSHEGPFGVGYGICAFELAGAEGACPARAFLSKYLQTKASAAVAAHEGEDPLVALARASLEAWVRERRRLAVPKLPAGLADFPAACFVSLKKHGELRGCIGTLEPTQASLAAEICSNARSAGTRDPRFNPVRPSELDELVYDVDVLGQPEEVASRDELDPKRYGVIVRDAYGRRGVLLPDLEGVDSVDYQLEIAARKGGIDLYDEGVRIERFEVERHI